MENKFLPLREDNLDCVLKIENAVFSVPWTKKGYLDALESNNFKGEVLIDKDNDIIGYYGLLTVFDEADIATLAVSKAYQSKGFGKVLLDRVVNVCKQNNIINVFLEVRASNNRAIALYEQKGFKFLGTRKNYYQGTEDAKIYRLTL